MDWTWLSKLGDLILVVGAIATALIAIGKVCKVPDLLFRRYKQKKDTEQRAKLQEIVSMAVKAELADMQKTIDKRFATLEDNAKFTKDALLDSIRFQILDIYDKTKEKKQLTVEQSYVLTALYGEYHLGGGNGEIAAIYNVMKTFQVVT